LEIWQISCILAVGFAWNPYPAMASNEKKHLLTTGDRTGYRSLFNLVVSRKSRSRYYLPARGHRSGWSNGGQRKSRDKRLISSVYDFIRQTWKIKWKKRRFQQTRLLFYCFSLLFIVKLANKILNYNKLKFTKKFFIVISRGAVIFWMRKGGLCAQTTGRNRAESSMRKPLLHPSRSCSLLTAHSLLAVYRSLLTAHGSRLPILDA
jgi:hypothetical protein